jgi:hypothetical protein
MGGDCGYSPSDVARPNIYRVKKIIRLRVIHVLLLFSTVPFIFTMFLKLGGEPKCQGGGTLKY